MSEIRARARRPLLFGILHMNGFTGRSGPSCGRRVRRGPGCGAAGGGAAGAERAHYTGRGAVTAAPPGGQPGPETRDSWSRASQASPGATAGAAAGRAGPRTERPRGRHARCRRCRRCGGPAGRASWHGRRRGRRRTSRREHRRRQRRRSSSGTRGRCRCGRRRRRGNSTRRTHSEDVAADRQARTQPPAEPWLGPRGTPCRTTNT